LCYNKYSHVTLNEHVYERMSIFMMSFRNEKLKNEKIPMNIVKLVGKINEYKGKQDLYIE